MKKIVLLLLGISTLASLHAQIVYSTVISGNYDDPNTWGGPANVPPTTQILPCNCKIVVKQGHTLSVNQDLDLTDIVVVVYGTLTPVTSPDLSRTIVLRGTAAIDVKSTGLITSGGSNQSISIETTEVWNENFSFPSEAPAGTVQGPASVVTGNTTWQSAALPVKLSDFTVSKSAKGVQLVWTTASEINASHFEIERSTDGATFSSIGQIGASGNSGIDQSYSFNDAAPVDGQNHYRLKIIDKDASYEYSLIRSVSFAAASLNVVVGPNPATSFVNVKISRPGNEPYRLRLVNRTGQVVYDQKHNLSGNIVQLNVTSFAEGSYILEVSTNSGTKQVNQIMIIRK